MNTQQPEKKNPLYTPLEVHSIFFTIQGEGPFSGTPAIFIRLAGCNLQCPGCDTDYTSTREVMTSQQVLDNVKALEVKTKLIVITGGEPFRQQLKTLIDLLLSENFYVQIETNGTLPLNRDIDFLINKQTNQRSGLYIVCSPKTGSVHPTIMESACVFKYVISADCVDKNDGLPILVLEHSASPRVARPDFLSFPNIRHQLSSRVIVQPMDTGNEFANSRNLQACIHSSLEFGYTLQIQLHKYLDLP